VALTTRTPRPVSGGSDCRTSPPFLSLGGGVRQSQKLWYNKTTIILDKNIFMKATYIDLLPEDYELYYKSLTPDDRFVNGRIRKNTTLFSRYKKLDLAGRSIFKVLSPYWHGFTEEQRTAWDNVGEVVRLSSWQAFVKDTAARWRYGYTGFSTPSEHHHAKFGKIKIASPATEIKICQYHPQYYYIRKKVRGKKNSYYPLKVEEYFTLPLELQISYKSNLSAVGPNPYLRFYAKIWHLYQGRDLYTDLVLELNLNQDWTTVSDSISEVLGLAIQHDLYIEAHAVQGYFYVDNIKSTHSGVNWVRDWDCDDINKVFGAVYYQVPQNWAPITIPDGAEYESIFEE
jgi:hypothetical protein